MAAEPETLTVRQKLVRDFTLAMIANPGGKKEKVQAASEYADLILKEREETKKRTFVNEDRSW